MRNGKVLIFGDNRKNQLNLPYDIESNYYVINSSCGLEHTSLVLNSGDVKLFGANNEGQLDTP